MEKEKLTGKEFDDIFRESRSGIAAEAPLEV